MLPVVTNGSLSVAVHTMIWYDMMGYPGWPFCNPIVWRFTRCILHEYDTRLISVSDTTNSLSLFFYNNKKINLHNSIYQYPSIIPKQCLFKQPSLLSFTLRLSRETGRIVLRMALFDHRVRHLPLNFWALTVPNTWLKTVIRNNSYRYLWYPLSHNYLSLSLSPSLPLSSSSLLPFFVLIYFN